MTLYWIICQIVSLHPRSAWFPTHLSDDSSQPQTLALTIRARGKGLQINIKLKVSLRAVQRFQLLYQSNIASEQFSIF